MLLSHLAEMLSAECVPHSASRDLVIERVSGVRTADANSLVFAESENSLQEAFPSAAGAILTTPVLAATHKNPTKPLLLVTHPRLAFAKAAKLLQAPPTAAAIHSTAILGSNVQIASSVSIGPYAVIGDHVNIGERTSIGAGCVLAPGTRIGANCTLFPRIVIYSGVTLHNRVVVHAGCVLGSDGFGYVRNAETGTYTQFPQQGTLLIEDDVEIGANTTIDRGALEETRISHGAKLDNLIHIGHNVRVCSNVVIAAQTGISGSSTVGDGAILGGQVGIGEHAEVGPNVILGGGAGVLSRKKLRGEGVVFWGRPAQPLREYLKGLATLARLTRESKE